MIYRTVQLILWIARAFWIDRCMERFDGYIPPHTFRYYLEVVFGGIASLVIWTVSKQPLWQAFFLQLGIDLWYIAGLHLRSRSISQWFSIAIWNAVLESGWLIGWVLSDPLCQSFYHPEGNLLQLFGAMGISIAFATVLFLISFRLVSKNVNAKQGAILMVIPVLNLYCAQYYAVHPHIEVRILCLLASLSGALIGSLVCRSICFDLFQRESASVTQAREDLLLAQEQTTMQNEELRDLRHSLKDHFLLLQMLNQEGKTKEIEHYLQALTGQISYPAFTSLCGDPLINAVLNQIQTSHPLIHFDFLVDPGISSCPFTVSEALFLLMDNACEEVERYPELPQVITVRIRRRITDIEIRVENPLSEHKTLDSEKEGNEHGRGIPRVRRIADQLNGTFTIDQTQCFSAILRFGQSKV